MREGDDGPTGDGEADAAWENLGRTYDYYRDTFGRDSYDDSGAELIATVHFARSPASSSTTPTGTATRWSSARATRRRWT